MIVDSPHKANGDGGEAGAMARASTISVFDAKENLVTLRKMLQDVSNFLIFVISVFQII